MQYNFRGIKCQCMRLFALDYKFQFAHFTPKNTVQLDRCVSAILNRASQTLPLIIRIFVKFKSDFSVFIPPGQKKIELFLY